jgi:hypothetical protein
LLRRNGQKDGKLCAFHNAPEIRARNRVNEDLGQTLVNTTQGGDWCKQALIGIPFVEQIPNLPALFFQKIGKTRAGPPGTAMAFAMLD